MSTVTEKTSAAGKLVRQMIGSVISSIHAGDEKMASRKMGSPGLQSLLISSTAFKNGSAIPRQYSPQGANISPELEWSGIPAGTAELVLIVEDPDAPMPKPFVHWIIHSIAPTVTSLPTGLPAESMLPLIGGAIQGQNGNNTFGWFGPKPPLGHGVHHYHFQLFALDKTLGLGSDATLEDLSKAMKGRVLADGEIIGTYERTADSEG